MVHGFFCLQAAEHSAQNLAAMSRPMEVDLRFASPAHTIHRIRGMESPSNHNAKTASTDPTPNPLLVTILKSLQFTDILMLSYAFLDQNN